MTYLGPVIGEFEWPMPERKRKYRSVENLTILAVDPGGVTGWSLISLPTTIGGTDAFSHSLQIILENKLLWLHGQIDCNDQNHGAYQLRKLMDTWDFAAVIFESFFIRKMAVDLSPVQITSVVNHHLWFHGRKMHFQQPSMAKRLDNDRLKLMNVYTSEGGLQHARDADRHALMIIRRCMEKPKGEMLKKELWPHVYG